MPVRYAVLLLTFVSFSVQAEVVEINWTPDGRFGFEALLDAGKFHEVCGDLTGGDVVQWELKATVPVDFNIHYHEGEEVVYPAQETGVSAQSDQLTVPVTQTYCWTLTNTQQDPSVIELDLERDMELSQ